MGRIPDPGQVRVTMGALLVGGLASVLSVPHILSTIRAADPLRTPQPLRHRRHAGVPLLSSIPKGQGVPQVLRELHSP